MFGVFFCSFVIPFERYIVNIVVVTLRSSHLLGHVLRAHSAPGEDVFVFADVLPGVYDLAVDADDWSWEQSSFRVEVFLVKKNFSNFSKSHFHLVLFDEAIYYYYYFTLSIFICLCFR
jgi:hypothetical protein